MCWAVGTHLTQATPKDSDVVASCSPPYLSIHTTKYGCMSFSPSQHNVKAVIYLFHNGKCRLLFLNTDYCYCNMLHLKNLFSSLLERDETAGEIQVSLLYRNSSSSQMCSLLCLCNYHMYVNTVTECSRKTNIDRCIRMYV